jgi:hypothetical protein
MTQIAVHDADDLARSRQSLRYRGAEPELAGTVRLAGDGARELFCEIAGAVGRVVVDDDDLPPMARARRRRRRRTGSTVDRSL